MTKGRQSLVKLEVAVSLNHSSAKEKPYKMKKMLRSNVVSAPLLKSCISRRKSNQQDSRFPSRQYRHKENTNQHSQFYAHLRTKRQIIP